MAWAAYVVDYGVMGLLLAMSVVAVAVAIERWKTYKRVSSQDFTDKKSLELMLTERLHLIATIGSSAPYVGLLGTVLGIMLTFATIGEQGFMDTSGIMVGLALALRATALGLFVAIPAVAMYNHLLRRVRVIVTRWEIEHGD